MSDSETSTMSSTSASMIGSVIAPGDFTAMPSAIVLVPDFSDSPFTAAYIAGKRSAWTP